MRTTFDIPEELLMEVTAVLKTKTRNEAVNLALRDFVKRRRRELLLSLRGNVNVPDASPELEEAELAEAEDAG